MKKQIIMLVLLTLSIIPGMYLMKYITNPDNQVRLNAATIAQGLHQAANVRQVVMQYYWQYGSFPNSNNQAGLKEPTEFSSDAVRSITVGMQGVITITYNSMGGVNDGQIILTPDYTNDNVGVQWKCETKSFPGIEELAPQCSYCPQDR